MGFYGNITNTSKTQFQFDKIYSSRYDMETQARTDGIYAGRYVLVEYDTDLSQDSFYRVFINGTDGQMYNAPGVVDVNENKLKIREDKDYSDNNGEDVYLPIGAFVFTGDLDSDTKKYINVVYYKITGDLYQTNKNYVNLIEGNYKQVTTDKTISPNGIESTVSNYTKNYAIDNEKYGAGRGYDSTVWQKTYIDNVEKYIMIAELNSVVPTFGVSADAPTAEPIAPHFDTQSTDLYYKLHWQPAWGMRIAKAGAIDKKETIREVELPSNESVSYKEIIYNNNTDKTEEKTVTYDGAIYYNKEGFSCEKHAYKENLDDQISVNPTGKSGTKYNQHNGKIDPIEQPDIQEISIMLPSLGNALCDIWDKIYGNNTNNVRYRDIGWKDAEEVNEDFTGKAVPDKGVQGDSEQGYMTRDPKTLAGCINMAHDLIGMIITDIPTKLDEEEYKKHFIYYRKDNDKDTYWRLYKYPKYKSIDLSWEAPTGVSDQEVNTSYQNAVKAALASKGVTDSTEVYLVDTNNGDKDEWEVRKYNKKAIGGKSLAIKNGEFGYKLVEIKEFADNMSTINGLLLSLRNLIESDNPNTRDRSTIQGTVNVLNDIIDCFNDLFPGQFLICDSNGKVNSANWTTKETYSYKNHGRKDPIPEGTNTKENQWISLSVDETVNEKDGTVGKITLKHQSHIVLDTISDSDKNNSSFNQTDTSGKKIENSMDGINNDNNINTLKLYTPIVDSAGHVVGRNTETVTLPFGYKYLETNNGADDVAEKDLYTKLDEENNITSTKKFPDGGTKAQAEGTQDKLTINAVNKWIQTKITNGTNSDTLEIAHEVHKIDKTEQKTNNNGSDLEVSQKDNDNIVAYDVEVDAAGHVIKNQKHTYTLPYGYKIIKVTNTKDTAVNNPDSDIKLEGQIADNTQDTLTFSASNKWIKLDNNTTDIIKVGHKLSNLDDSASANKYYGLEQDETITTLDVDNKFEVPCFKFDEAGHVIGARTHTVKLPENFNKIAVTTSSVNNADSETGTATTDKALIEADSLSDTITFAEGNRWINITPDISNDKLTFSHYIKQFNETTNGKTDYNSDNNKSFTVQEINWDQAGHIVSSDKHTYTLSDGIKNIGIANTGSSNESFDNISSSTGTLTAESLVDTFKIDTKNRWIQPIVDITNKTISFYHAEAGAKKSNSTNEAQTPEFGKEFNIPVINWDAAGHITSASTQTVTIPSPNGAVKATGSSVLTGFTIDSDTGAVTYTHGDISNLKLTGYKEKSAQEEKTGIYTGDTINQAFRTLENLIDGYIGVISNLTTRIGSYESTINDLEARVKKLEDAAKPTA